MSDMVRMGLRPASLALAAALCFGTSAQAADDPLVAQVSLTLSGLTFQLIDLTPGDGIAPSLSFQAQGMIDSGNWSYDEASETYSHVGPQFQNSLLPGAPLNYVSPDGLSTVTSTSNSVTLQSQLPLSQVLPSLTPPDGTGSGDYASHWSGSGTDLNVGSPYGDYQSFTLGAGTGLVVQGNLSTRFTMDSSAVQSAVEASGYDTWSLSSYGGAVNGGFLMAAKLNEVYGEDGNYGSFTLQQGNRLELSGSTSAMHGTGYSNDPLDQSDSEDFEFTVVNFGASDLTGVVALNLSVYGNFYMTASRFSPPPIDLPPIDIPAIPEPSTYALMGLGLVGIATVARRRRLVS